MPVEIRVPHMGESVVEATIGKWLKREGESVTVGEPLVSLETDKVNLDVAATDSGLMGKILKPEGETVRPDDVIGEIAAGNGAAPAVAPKDEAPAAQEAAAPAASEENGKVRASPLAERVADDLHVDLNKVPATGAGQRVIRSDVEAFAGASSAGASGAAVAPKVEQRTPTADAVTSQPSAVQDSGRRETRQRLSRRRLTIARRLVEAQQTAAMLTTFNEVDMSAVMELRARRKEEFTKRYGVSLGFMSFFTKAAIGALKAFPQVNAELQGEELVLKDYYDIGVAIGDADGLVVPILRNAERLSFAGIEKAIGALVEKSKAKALTLEDLQGGTFTITNGGVFGSLLSTPILNPPQVGILGMHKIEQRPVAVNGEVVIRPMMYLALSYDHRIVDGREAVQFLVRVKELIEDPERLMLEG